MESKQAPENGFVIMVSSGHFPRTLADGIRIGAVVSDCGRLCSAIYSRGLAAQVPAADTFIHGAWPSAAIYIVIYNVLPAVRTRVASPPAFVVQVRNFLGPILRCGSGSPGLLGRRHGPRLTPFELPATCSFSCASSSSHRVTTLLIYRLMPWSWVCLYVSVLGEVVLPAGGLQAFFFQRLGLPHVLLPFGGFVGEDIHQTFLVRCPASPHCLASLPGSLQVLVIFLQ